ncbi:MAG: trehalose-phosphatase, partial [Thermodesulfobacteriota bacterium]
YYRLADFAVISSVYDGMNLVAKEYVASQVDEKGVLILSELAGAAESLDGALLVNPYDLEAFSDNIKKALRMPEWEKRGRMKTLRTQVREENVYKWIGDILKEIDLLVSSKGRDERYLFNRLAELEPQLKDQPLTLFLDYDGTLTPIMDSPDLAVLSPETRALLLRLKDLTKLVIISGRSLAELRAMVDIPDLLYVGNHGAEICDGEAVSITHNPTSDQKLLPEFIMALRQSLTPIPGMLVEEKGITASIHFRQVPLNHLGTFFDLFWKTAETYKDHFRITKGKKVLEIRPLTAWNKGDAVEMILRTSDPGSFSIYVGDDTTDEDAYKVLREKGLSISVGRNPNSDYHLYRQTEIHLFLEQLVILLKKNKIEELQLSDQCENG